MSAKLFVVGTPIGNLKDISYRAVEILSSVDVIAAEDTRNTGVLLKAYDIKTPMISYHEHNKYSKGEYIVSEFLRNDKSVALVSDAGMPMISDPGLELVQLCIDEGIEVTTVPGPTAMASAIVLSGMVKKGFVFEGFLPVKKSQKKAILNDLIFEKKEIIFYEAPHKLLTTLNDLLEAFGNRKIAVCREITKLHEEAIRGALDEVIDYFSNNSPRGEFVLILEGLNDNAANEEQAELLELSVKDHVQVYVNQGIDIKQAMKLAAKDRGVKKSEIYKELL